MHEVTDRLFVKRHGRKPPIRIHFPNENFGKAGAIIVPHENVRKRLKDGATVKAFNKVIEPMPKQGLLMVTFTQDVTFHLSENEP